MDNNFIMKHKKHLSSFRVGWENEKLAVYLLSRISFVSSPNSIGDDSGFDCYCTLFKTEQEKKHEYLFPLNAFLIQIKSNKDKFELPFNFTNKLNIPYFIAYFPRIGKRVFPNYFSRFCRTLPV